MKENLQTEQILELGEEQVTAICGGGLSMATKIMNLQEQDIKGAGYGVAAIIQKNISKNAEVKKEFDVGKGWAKRLAKR